MNVSPETPTQFLKGNLVKEKAGIFRLDYENLFQKTLSLPVNLVYKLMSGNRV